MIIQHNMNALTASRRIKITVDNLGKNSEKLSSGYRINRAADDAAGLAISEKLRNQIRGLRQASRNSQDGISLIQVAEGALGEMHSIVHRLKELSVQAANDVNDTMDRNAIQQEVNQLVEEIDKIADNTEFNKIKLLNGSLEAGASPIISISNDVPFGSETVIQGLENVVDVLIENPVIDASAESAIGATKAGNLQEILADSIVPQAVNSFINTFPAFATAGGWNQVSQEIGLKVYADSSSTLAYVSCKYSYDSTGKLLEDTIKLNLSVNVSSLNFETDNQLSADSRRKLETTIVHEMMHAFMDDTLINGMLGAVDGVRDKTQEFPQWFTEGMAQCASGGCSNDNDWVKNGLHLTEASTVDEITAAVTSSANKLSSGTTTSQYGTGYLATMYLGYMAAGSPASLTATELAGGLNTILDKMMSGDSLDDVINDISGGTYTSAVDFQNKFGDNDSAQFVYALLNAVGSTGNGGVVSDLTDDDLLDDNPASSLYYAPDVDNEYVVSSVGSSRNWNTGALGATSSAAGIGGSGNRASAAMLGPLHLQVGANTGDSMYMGIEDMHANKLGVVGMSVMSHVDASAAISACDDAVNIISDVRTKLGAYMNRLEHTIAYADNAAENAQAAESRVRDMDMAAAMVEYSKNNILLQAGQSMLSQAKSNQESIVNLLQA